MPAIVARSISILSDAGLGMAMFSLGTLFKTASFSYVYQPLEIISTLAVWMGCRTVHGVTAKDHCMWKYCGCFRYGCSFPYRPCCHGCCFRRSWTKRSSIAHCHCPSKTMLQRHLQLSLYFLSNKFHC